MNLSIPIAALSSNKAWAGRRFKSKYYTDYESDIVKILPMCKETHLEKTELFIEYIFHVKNYAQRDVDNMVKPLQDLLVKRGYITDDRYIKAITARKEKALSEEMIEVRIEPYLK